MVIDAGNLQINADQITLGAGDKSIKGFDTVTLAAAKQIVAQGTSNVTIDSREAVPTAHNLVLQAGQITGTNKSDLTITASNDAVTIQPVAGFTPSATEALNAKLTVVGKSIADNGVIDLPSGSVTLHATGTAATDGVTLGNGSTTIASGVSKTISGQTVYAQAGTVSLIADNGAVDIKGGSVVDVSGANGGGDAGSINIAATNGAVSVAGNLKGSADASYAQGSFTLDAKSLSGSTTNALTELNDTLTTGSFTTLRDIRVRTGDLTIAADAPGTVRAKAQTYRLTADDADNAGKGNIIVNGAIDSSATSGGTIFLAAKNNLTLNAGLDAHANGTDQKGGKVTLETTTGTIELNNQLIDVHGNAKVGSATGGNVLLRAPQIKTYSDVAINNTGGASLDVSPGAAVTVEAFRAYTAPASLTVANVAGYYNDATTFADNHAAAIKTRLGMLADPNMHLTPGVELDRTGNLMLAEDWDLSGWRFNNGLGTGPAFNTEAGILTLRATGNLQFGTGTGATPTASLVDGFAYTSGAIDQTQYILRHTDPSGAYDPSWSYRLAAGADLSSADVMAVKTASSSTTGNVLLVKGSEDTVNNTFTMEQVRTGTGFIDIAAGGNLSLGNRDSVIYTAGLAADGGQDLYGNPIIGPSYFGANSGDLNIRVKGDINGAANGAITDQLITDWQIRQPNYWTQYGNSSLGLGWWIDIGAFRQGVGALGGGNVSVTAGGNINSLSASTPTTGYFDQTNSASSMVLLGGGNLSVTAGRDINSGIFYVGNGQGTIRAGGNLGVGTGLVGSTDLVSPSTTKKTLYGTLLAMDHGHFDVRTGGDLILQAALNPTALPQADWQGPYGYAANYFFTYADTTGVSLSSLSGNVTLTGMATNAFTNTKNGSGGFFYLNSGDGGAASVYPGSLQSTAMGGNIIISGLDTKLFPSTTGELKLVAAQDIQLSGRIFMSDAAPGELQTYSNRYNDSLGAILQSEHSSVHASDMQPVIMSAGGSIMGKSDMTSTITLPKAAQIEAGQDVKYVNLTVQNLNSQDTTSIVSGRDISTSQVVVAGPGQVVLQAGRNVDFGTYDGVTTTGNLTNLLLPEQGASVTVLAGVGQGTTATQAFIDKYIDPSTSANYGNDLIAYVGKYDGVVQGQTAAQAFTAFGSLSKPLQDAFVRQVFFSELRQTGRSAVSTGNYKSGYDAIATLFPFTGYKGDINLYYSQIKTLRGGDINLLTPGGGVNAGLANPSSSGIKKPASRLGIVTVKGGDVNAFVNNDFTVNQSRVFTLQGGNIMMWSSYGNIDAGKGSKTVSSTPPPLLIVDPKTGTFTVDLTGSIVGSGIRVLLANKDVVPGSVDLYAPSGEINAGDAGIGSAGNIYLGALVVRGADNINFGGTSAGVPVAAPAPVSVGLGNLTDASKVADQATSSIAGMGGMNTNDFKPTFLSIEVIGLGDGSSQ